MNSIKRYINFKLLLISLILVFLFSGIGAAYIHNSVYSCTGKGCECTMENSENVSVGSYFEISCNVCDKGNYLFYTGIINIGESCKYDKVVECRGVQNKDGYIYGEKIGDHLEERKGCNSLNIESKIIPINYKIYPC